MRVPVAWATLLHEKFDKDAGLNPIDQMKVVGQAVDRIDGPLKTTGTARYAYEQHDVAAHQAYGVIVGASIAKGRIVSFDAVAARAAPGVISVIGADNAGTLDIGDFYVARALADPEVQHYHQAVAIVVADTFEQACAAAALVRVGYQAAQGAYDLDESRAGGVAPARDPDTAIGNPASPSGARVRLDAQGIVTVAAEMMGVGMDRVVVRLGDSDFPQASGSLGQRGANSATSGVYAACVKLRAAVAARVGIDAATAEFVDGHVIGGGRRVPLAQAAAAGALVGEDRIEFGEAREDLAHQTFGAHFVEVAVDAYTGEVRVRRMLAVCAAGRILNPKLARSQVIGAMTMGVGAALMEELAIDKRRGFFVNHDLASYEVPVHADIPHQEVIFLEDTDPHSSPMKAKGVGELGISGVAAAVANAIHHATGVRTRDYPITLDKLVDQLEPVA